MLWYKRLLFIIILSSLPFALLGISELLLSLFQAGIDPSPFTELSQGLVVDNPSMRQLYHGTLTKNDDTSEVKSHVVSKVKPPETFRVFVLGGSTAQGFPFFSNHSFSKVLELSLQDLGLAGEVINVGQSALSSYYSRDLFPRLLEYQPDLVVLYIGHNEYYGSPGVSSNQSHFFNLVFLSLKNHRWFQLLSQLLRPTPQARATMMESKFMEASWSLDTQLHEKVDFALSDNIQSILKLAEQKKVRVILMEPVSNLIDQPPFRGTSGGQKMGWSREVLKSPETWSQFESAVNSEGLTTDPHYLYLRGLYQLSQGLPQGLADLRRAKDLDAAPFRAPAHVVETLHSAMQDKQGVFWFPTTKILEKAFGPGALGKTVFVDHLHFDYPAQVVLGIKLAEQVWTEVLKSNKPPVLPSMTLNQWKARMHLTPLFEWKANQSLVDLFRADPFRSMSLPMVTALPHKIKNLESILGPDLTAELKSNPFPDWWNTALAFYQSKNDAENVTQNLRAFVWTNPGSWVSHFVYGSSLGIGASALSETKNFFDRAYLLSNFDSEVLKKIKSVYTDYVY